MRRTLTLSLLLSACARSYVVIHEGPVPAQCQVSLAPVSFEQLRVGDKSEAQWQSHKNPESQASWDEDKNVFVRNFGNALFDRAGAFIAKDDAPYVLQPHLLFYEPGFYAFAAARDTEVVMQLALVDTQTHAEVDLIQADVWIGSDLTNPSTGGRFHSAGKVAGARFGQYLNDRFANCRR